MTVAQSKKGILHITTGTLNTFVETGTGNTALTTTIPAMGAPFRLLAVLVAYSAAPTQTGVTITLDSGAGSGYDTLLTTGTANSRYTVYQPTGDLVFGNDDGLVVVAPAAGGVITASISVYVEKL
jgi:hypothetical protein